MSTSKRIPTHPQYVQGVLDVIRALSECDMPDAAAYIEDAFGYSEDDDD